MRTHRFKYLPAILSILLAGCSATKLVGFSDPDYRAAAFKSVAVYASTTDLMWRQALENSMVEAFAAVGVPAVATVNFLPPTREYSPEDRRRILKEQGTMALVVIEVGGVGVEETYIPVYGSTTRESGTITSNGTGLTYSGKSQTTYQGGYSVSKPWARMETKVLEIESGRTAWISSSYSGGSALSSFEDLQRSYSMELVRELGKQRIVLTTKPLSALDGLNKGPGRLR